jgi:sRNA-binding carbon storage regulator CsrA
MLILCIKLEDGVIIYTSDGPITIKIKGVHSSSMAKNKSVRLGFILPSDSVRVVREELLRRDIAGDRESWVRRRFPGPQKPGQ